MSLPPWRPVLKAAQQRDGHSPSARWLQLATIATDGTPRVRTLVFRGWHGDDQLLLFTDGRSEKCEELNHQPAAEVCWLFAKAKQQFRLRGVISRITPERDPALVRHYWGTMRDSGRALWAWPQPGAAFSSDALFADAVPEDTAPPDHFVVCLLAVAQVELLDLTQHPHRRTRWALADLWREHRLNP